MRLRSRSTDPARSGRRPRIVGLLAAALVAAPLLVAASLPSAPMAAAAVPAPRQPHFGKSIEPMANYVGQTSCQPGYRKGTLALGRFLVSTYPNTSFGGAYACGTDGARSEHYDGRAIDWMNSVRNHTQAAQASAVIKYLLATDRYGNRFANARRMGVMYIIWNNKMWGSWSGKWEDYNGCAKTPAVGMDSACHRNHMHISLSWSGALGRTSFFSQKVYPVQDNGPCRQRDLNWSADYAVVRTARCPSYSAASAPAHAGVVMRQLVAYSGAVMFPGMSGEPIKAVQRAFGRAITGKYDSGTVSAVKHFQRAHHLRTTGVLDATSWRMLLAVYKHH